MEIKISLLFLFFIATTEEARQCSSQGKLSPNSQITDNQKSNNYYLITWTKKKIENILISERCVPQSTCRGYQDDQERLGHAFIYNWTIKVKNNTLG